MHDKYDGDLGLLSERWAAKEDRELFSSEQIHTFGEYLEKVRFLTSDALSPELRRQIEQRIGELEPLIAPEVITTLSDRLR